MNSSIYNEEEETDESLRPKSAKRIKLEHVVDTSGTTAATNETTTSTDQTTTETQSPATTATTSQNAYSKQELIDYFENEYNKKRESFVDKLLELFFLQEGGNLTEYYTWRKKPPTNPLLQYFKQVAKGDETEFESLQYDKAKLDLIINLNTLKITPLSVVLADTQTSSQQTGLNQPPSSASSIGSSSLHQQQAQTQSPFTLTSNLTSLSSTSNLNSNANSSLTHLNTTSQFTTPSAVSSKLNVNNQQLSSSSKNVISSPFSTPTSYHHSHHLSQTSKLAQLNSSSLSQFSKSLPSTPLGVGQSTKKSSRFHHTLSAGSPSVTTPTAANISSVYESSIGSKEQIVERAKQEAHVVQRIAELRKEGLWSAKRLPRLQEPPREKAHWDYLLEEMTWLATDFAQERKWKKASAKKCARMIMKYHGDKESQFEKAEKENILRLRKIASTISKEIRQFWSSVEKLVDYKMQTKLEEKRKKALDLHLNFIVGQTEKYSSWLAEGLNKNPSTELVDEEENSNDNEAIAEEVKTVEDETAGLEKNDQEFNLSDQDESDFEDTIAEQERNENKQQNAQELKDLENEAEMPIEDLLKWYAEMEDKNEHVDSESMDDEEDFDETEDQDEEDDTMNESEVDQSNEESDKEEIGVEYLINLDSETSEVSLI